jgi:hypothetical protein
MGGLSPRSREGHPDLRVGVNSGRRESNDVRRDDRGRGLAQYVARRYIMGSHAPAGDGSGACRFRIG